MTKSLYVFYNGYDEKNDAKIRKLLGDCREEGSGFAFFNGERDISFSVSDRDIKRLKKKVEKAGFRAEIYEDD